jgi:hypothetical protein
MTPTYLSEITKTMSTNVEIEFSVDFQGQCEYVQSENTEQFLEYEQIILFLVEKEIIPINERTEGLVEIVDGIVNVNYRTCTQVGDDWDTDVWEEGSSENPISELVKE